MNAFICITCGTQYPPSTQPPSHCPICEDDRQYVNLQGQSWITPQQLHAAHHSVVRQEEPGLIGLGTEPRFAIGQRALLVQTPSGNVLWDCISLINDRMVSQVQALGGISAIAISHPHYYSSMGAWSRAFGNIPIYLHRDNAEWVMHPDPAIVFWDGETHPLAEGLTEIRCGGHFPGSTVLHWDAGAAGRGVLLTGDTINVIPDRRYVSFMYSYPNLIPLPAPAVERIAQAVQPFHFDRIYAAWFDAVVPQDAHAAVQRSALRYIRSIQG